MTSAVPIWTLFVVLIVVLSIACLCAVLLFRTSAAAIQAVNSAADRNNEYTQGLVDRIVAGDWQTYKAYELMEKNEVRERQPVPHIEDVPVGDVRGGFGSRLGLSQGFRVPISQADMPPEE